MRWFRCLIASVAGRMMVDDDGRTIGSGFGFKLIVSRWLASPGHISIQTREARQKVFNVRAAQSRL